MGEDSERRRVKTTRTREISSVAPLRTFSLLVSGAAGSSVRMLDGTEMADARHDVWGMGGSYQGWARCVRKEEEEEKKNTGREGRTYPPGETQTRTLESKQQQRDGKRREAKGIPEGPVAGVPSGGS